MPRTWYVVEYAVHNKDGTKSWYENTGWWHRCKYECYGEMEVCELRMYTAWVQQGANLTHMPLVRKVEKWW